MDRVVLNYKGLPYRTEWVEYPDIEPTLRSIGGEPTAKVPLDDGSGGEKDHYTLPAIHDSSTGAVITDSWAIAEYLDTNYPSTPRIFPFSGCQTSIWVFRSTFAGRMFGDVYEIIVPRVVGILREGSVGYFIKTREKQFGRKLEEMEQEQKKEGSKDGRWVKFREGLEMLAGGYERYGASGKEKGEGTVWYFGEMGFSYADAIVVGCLVWIREVFGKESEEWRAIEEVKGGFWKRFVQECEHLLVVA